MAEQRRSQRRRVKEWGRLLFEDGRPIQTCVILDLSDGGASLVVEGAVSLPDSFLFFRKSDRSLREAVVVRRGQRALGVRFLAALDPDSARARAFGLF